MRKIEEIAEKLRISIPSLADHSPTLKLDIQKNGHKGVCVHHKANGDSDFCPVWAIGQRYVYIHEYMNADWDTYLLEYWDDNGKQGNVTGNKVWKQLKLAASELKYPETIGIPTRKVNTHSLHSGGANGLSLNKLGK